MAHLPAILLFVVASLYNCIRCGQVFRSYGWAAPIQRRMWCLVEEETSWLRQRRNDYGWGNFTWRNTCPSWPLRRRRPDVNGSPSGLHTPSLDCNVIGRAIVCIYWCMFLYVHLELENCRSSLVVWPRKGCKEMILSFYWAVLFFSFGDLRLSYSTKQLCRGGTICWKYALEAIIN